MTPVRVKSIAIAGALLAAVSANGAQAAPKNRQVQHIAVAQFDAENSARARSAVLDTLSDHNDVEVVSLDDINVAAKRLGVDATTPAGRAKLSEELGIEAWLDGKIEDDHAQFTLHGPDGGTLATTSIRGHRASVAEGLAGQKVWEAMGPLLSPRERAKRAFEAQQELAVKKVQAREQELARLRQLVVARAQARTKQLKAAQSLAREKRAAFVAELDRQRTLVSERTASAERERKEAERKQNEADEAEFLASLQESSGPPEESAEPATASPSRTNTNVWAESGGNVWAASAKTSAPAVAVAPAQPAASTVSPWLMTQGGGQPVPAQQYAPRPAPAVNQDGLSPATRAWLAQQGMR